MGTTTATSKFDATSEGDPRTESLEELAPATPPAGAGGAAVQAALPQQRGMQPPLQLAGEQFEEDPAASGEKELDGVFLDEQALLASSTFKIPPHQLIQLAKEILSKHVHLSPRLSEDFEFSTPFIGPLDKHEFRATMESLELRRGFPDMRPRFYHLRVDPLEPGRVWVTSRPIATHTGEFRPGRSPWRVRPTGKLVELPPQTSSLTFNEDGQVSSFTFGYVMDRRCGNTQGLGGAFGLLWAIGMPLPYPEGRPWSSSLQQRLFNTHIPFLQALCFLVDRAASAVLPSWLYTTHQRNIM